MHPGTDFLSQGDAMFTAKDFRGAADAYRQVVTQNPMLGAGWAKLTVALTAIGDYDGAADAGAKAVVFAPRELDAKYGYAYSLVRLERFREAVDQLDEILAENTHRDDARNLLLWSLQQAGTKLSADDPHEAERFLDRAHKLRPESPEPIVALVNLYADSQQHGKITRLLGGMPKMLQEPAISTALQTISSQNPDAKRAIDQGMMAARAQGPAAAAVPAPNRQGVHYVPCPKCHRSVADFAALCPHCGHQIRSTSRFANRDTGPDHAWQDIALNIMLVLYALISGALSVLFFTTNKVGEGSGWEIRSAIVGIVISIVCIAALWRDDTAMSILKWGLVVRIFVNGLALIFDLSMGHFLDAAIDVLVVGAAGFLLYLVSWASD